MTGLAKPRSYARQGMTIATTASRLELATAKYDPIRPTGIDTTLGEAALKEVVGWLGPQEQGTITIPGVIHPELFKKMVALHPRRLENKELVFTSALHLLAAGSPKAWLSRFMQLHNQGTRISFITPVPLHFITVNPFYPKFLQQSGEYIPAYVDKQELLETARSRITTTPVSDILQPPHPDLLALCGLLPKACGG